MKKFLALVLAVAMAMSMASVAFAADTSKSVVTLANGATAFKYESDENVIKDTGFVKYGDVASFALLIDGAPVTKFDAVEKLKVKAEFEMGEDLVESISIVKKYIDDSVKRVVADPKKDVKANNVNDSIFDASGYYYFVDVKVAAKEVTADADIIGTFEFNRKAVNLSGTANDNKTDAQEKQIKDCKVDFALNVFYADKDYIGTGATLVTEEINLDYDTAYALKFKSDEDVELNFGKDGYGLNEGTFTVDASGQGKVYIKWNTKVNEAIVAANPGVKMFFVNFNNVKFNRAGEFEYEMEDVAAAYKVVGDELVAIPGAELDVDTVTFNTRVLENYVFATEELVNPVVAAPVVDAPAAEVTNPSTGA